MKFYEAFGYKLFYYYYYYYYCKMSDVKTLIVYLMHNAVYTPLNIFYYFLKWKEINFIKTSLVLDYYQIF